VLTEVDFWDYCAASRIVVREVQLEQPGYSMVYEGRLHIYIHDQLRGVDRLYTLYHELAHHWLHPPRIQFFLGMDKNIEFEANLVAACALIPKTLLAHHWPSEIAEEFSYPTWLIKYRQTLLEYWDI